MCLLGLLTDFLLLILTENTFPLIFFFSPSSISPDAPFWAGQRGGHRLS